MKVTIAVASLNYGRFLGDCLGSLANQDYGDFEVLIADGGSIDESLTVIRQYCDSDARFRLVSTRDEGQADAINKALKKASGEIIGFLNADDYFLCTDALSAVVRAFRTYPGVDVVSFKAWYVSETGQHIKPVHHRHHPFDNLSWMKYRPQVVQPATFWTPRVLAEVPVPVEFHYVFDSVFFFQAYQRFSFLELGKPVAGYRLHGANKSLSVRSARVLELARFEQLKFGDRSLRAAYLRAVGKCVRSCERFPKFGAPLGRALYLWVNSLAWATFYRLPGI